MAAEPPKQKALEGNEKTEPTLAQIRELFTSHISKISYTDWLQAPNTDSDCEQRAKRLVPQLTGIADEPAPKLFNVKAVLAGQWDWVDKTLAKTPVLVKARDTFIGGDKSNFNSGDSHHVVLFLAKGVDGEGEFYVGFDPDVTATTETRAAWKEVEEAVKKGDTSKAVAHMVLGPDGKVLGSLCRKYYVKKAVVFPPIRPSLKG